MEKLGMWFPQLLLLDLQILEMEVVGWTGTGLD